MSRSIRILTGVVLVFIIIAYASFFIFRKDTVVNEVVGNGEKIEIATSSTTSLPKLPLPPATYGTSTVPVKKSGITGTALLGPVCPVERDPPEPACADKPFTGSLLVTTQDGRSVKEFSTDSKGEFTVQLSPGFYLITNPPNASMLPRCGSNIFQVEAPRLTPVTVSCDTGIR